MATVNLDALIPREDFLASDGADFGASGKSEASRTDLVRGESFYVTLRKPDFQRETAAWTPESVRDFIQAFIDGDLIPSVICWQSPYRLSFVIDGAHRLSAIIAWLQDDYGDNTESIKFYNNNIPDEQRRIAEKTRQLVNSTIGSYKEFRAESENPGSNQKLTVAARALGHSSIPLLWVKGQDSKKAERAFLTINQSAVQIDPTELKLLNARFKPNAIAARAIVRNATGHKYWEKFSETGQQSIEAMGKQVYAALYSPVLNTPIRSTELPIAGHGYGSQTLPLIFDFVNIANGLPVIDASKAKRELKLIEHTTPDETETISVMKNAEKLARRITGVHPSSIGLHPAVYFYSSNGRHQPTAVLAMAALLKDMESADSYAKFTSIRANFENFLLDHKMFVNQITLKYGSMAKGYKHLKGFFDYVIEHMLAGAKSGEIEELLKEHPKYQILVKEKPVLTSQAKNFTTAAKQLKFLSDAMERTFLCEVCGARIDSKSMHLDHRDDKKFGGAATTGNARWLHPYCDSTYKAIQAAAAPDRAA